MKCTLTLGPMTVSPVEVEALPDKNPVATVAAYLHAEYPEHRMWVAQDEPGEGYARKVWYKADENGNPTGGPCASITISEG